MKKTLTLCMVVREGEILLGMKKRGFGAGRYNGFGGKVEAGESVTAAAVRELQEEAGLTASELSLTGRLTFTFQSGSEPLQVFVYRVTAWTGEPVETEEMRPEWFQVSDIPYTKMWSDDEYWLPHFLAETPFTGTFRFDAPATATHPATVISHMLDVTSCEDFLKNDVL